MARNVTYIVCLSALILIIAGCGKNTSGNNKGNARIAVMIKDAAGMPLPGFLVSTTPATITSLTDSLGCATLDNIPAGEFDITVQKTAYAPYTRKTILTEWVTINFDLVYLPQSTVTVKDDRGKCCTGAVITTVPPTWERIADSGGQAVFQKMPQAAFRFAVKREGYPVENFDMGAETEVPITVFSGSPQMVILSPANAKTFGSNRGIRFQGTGQDHEDGELPESSLVWISSMDGELGWGRDITVNELSFGQHKISLRGKDSDGKTGEAQISINVADFQLDTFFPVPVGESWNYRYLTPQFVKQNDQGQLEQWIFNEMTVYTEQGDNNKLSRRIEIDFQVDKIHYLYELIDYLELKNNTIFVSATEEQIYLLQSSLMPILEMQINTKYAPSSVFLKNITDIASETTYESKVQTSTTTIYYIRGVSEEPYTESAILTTSIQVAGNDVLQTEKGTFNVVNLTIRQGEYTKNWALAKGVGLVRFEDNTFLDKGAGILSNASILRYYVPGPSKQASANLPNSAILSRPSLDQGEITSKNLHALRTILRSICPR